ncbi:MAG: type III pantothenate kinase [Cyclobacteriaceae bacterium]|nr:type III pantothenate kinase [Cyclobacteriaceae bacterium]
MLLTVDIGNSDIVIGVYDADRWSHLWRIPARTDQPELYYGIKVREFFFEARLQPAQVEKIILSSVVPALTDRIRNVIRGLFDKEAIVLGPAIYPRLPIGVLNPYEIGSDLVANALAAWLRFNRACVVVDFGTALTFTAIDSKGAIAGVAILPGLKTAIRSLSQNTAKLFDVPLEMPASMLGRNTVNAIQAGVLGGYEGLVRSLGDKIRAELGGNAAIIATGGLSAVITPLQDYFDAIDTNLTLEGIRRVGEFT